MNEELERLSMLIGSDDISKLSKKCVCIVGVGGVGGYVIESLVRSGIGKFIIVDFDVVTTSNINRQIIALHSTIGQKKVDLWEKRIKDISFNCEVVSYDTFYDNRNREVIFSEKIDFLVDACDTVSSKKILIEECLNRKIPFITSMGTGNRLDPSQIVITNLLETSYDPLARMLRKWSKNMSISDTIPVLCSKEHPVKTGTFTPGSSAFVPSSAGLLIGSYVLKTLRR